MAHMAMVPFEVRHIVLVGLREWSLSVHYLDCNLRYMPALVVHVGLRRQRRSRSECSVILESKVLKV